ncbi:N-acetylmuramoyl-L-alanine amidase [Loktanella sp. DSM 29012]|uniref:N-acetylmuramoyl-L-alanine amidase n=1 Tax=Loktanella sp. DSM 29012 TaxID=1881056 RepID=UPI0008BF0C9E|nr:N-acetylmuramoyl-L-alanine amidase [Loktanella sp. DSM 29012]SEQ59420.1 N-acetylmuramoyl-L-alanine amidase [Loktanella sp. DSM 29012]
MKLSRHKISTATWQAATHVGGTIEPTLIVLHDTASRLDEGSAADYLADNAAKVSVHFVVERDGSLIQQVATNRRANHAGRSEYHGQTGCNGFSIGIEIVNPGRMTAAGHGFARTWFKETFNVETFHIHEVTTDEHGHGWWMDYTPEQIATVTALCTALFAGIPTLMDIRTHWYVSPGRKTDTNPLFPLEAIRAKVLGRDDPADIAAEEQSSRRQGQQLVQIATRGSRLNMRRWPSFNPNVIAAIPDGTAVPVIREGVFAGRPWMRVLWGGQEGWIVADYTTELTKPI